MTLSDIEINEAYLYHTNPANGQPLLTADELDELYQYQEYNDQVEGEIEAENAWLRAAEAPSYDDMAFEDWERRRGCY